MLYYCFTTCDIIGKQHTSAYVVPFEEESSIRQHTWYLRHNRKAYEIDDPSGLELVLDLRSALALLLHTPAYVSIRQHTSATRSITLADLSSFLIFAARLRCCCIRQHTSAHVSIRQHTSAYVFDLRSALALLLHTSAYVSIRQHTSAYVSTRF